MFPEMLLLVVPAVLLPATMLLARFEQFVLRAEEEQEPPTRLKAFNDNRTGAHGGSEGRAAPRTSSRQTVGSPVEPDVVVGR